MVPAVVLSCHTMGLGIIRALGSMGVPTIAVSYERNDMGHVSRYVTACSRAPHPERDENAFLDTLRELARRHGRAFLVPADDATLLTVSRHKETLREHFIVACPDWETTERFLDKALTYRLADEAGVPAPATFPVTSPADLERCASHTPYPVVLKPRYSHRYFAHFGRKLFKADGLEALKVAYREASDAGMAMMVQELIPGDDPEGVNYNAYAVAGEARVECLARKVRLSPPGFGVPCVVASCPAVAEVVEAGRKMLKALRFDGFACTEFKRDPRNGVYKLMEVNGRFNRSNLLSLRAGINFAWLAYRHRVEGVAPAASEPRSDICWIDEFRDLYTTGRRCLQGRCSLKSFFYPYRQAHVFAVFDPRDPMPFIKRCGDLAVQALRAPLARQRGRVPARRRRPAS